MSSSAKTGDAHRRNAVHFRLGFIATFAKMLRDRRRRARSRHELQSLSDYGLRDIGVARCEIDYLIADQSTGEVE